MIDLPADETMAELPPTAALVTFEVGEANSPLQMWRLPRCRSCQIGDIHMEQWAATGPRKFGSATDALVTRSRKYQTDFVG